MQGWAGPVDMEVQPSIVVEGCEGDIPYYASTLPQPCPNARLVFGGGVGGVGGFSCALLTLYIWRSGRRHSEMA